MNIMHDIYNPPPAPLAYIPPTPERLHWTLGDLACLLGLCAPLFAVAAWAWSFEPSLWPWVIVGGSFVVLESWFSALSFLHRHPQERRGARWMIFLAALLPWIIGLGFAAALMMALFKASDWVG
jgi:hypothetical protein